MAIGATPARLTHERRRLGVIKCAEGVTGRPLKPNVHLQRAPSRKRNRELAARRRMVASATLYSGSPARTGYVALSAFAGRS